MAVKEVMEETGLEVTVERLLAVLDKKCHPHPPEPWYVYKFFVLCKKTGGEISRETNETSEIAYFGLEELPPLSEVRNTFSQLELMFEFHKNPAKEVILD
ncbi:NUDIX domain-containing protein [Pseudarcicella hirudinis]|uniref:NUDIX domain-containing protein n=1 Tax=Pseudarcicella hirudinis TaxID=1079859 RepID=UPI0035E9A3F5